MKVLRNIKLSLAALSVTAALLSSMTVQAAEPTGSFEQSKPLRIALVNFKTCVEKSKLGQKEQLAFDGMKKQMETILLEKEKALTDVSSKFNDMDYLDSLSPDAEAELKRQYRTLTQEFSQQQNQFYQTLSQTNVAIVQKLTDAVTKAAEQVAKANKIDLVLNEDSRFYSVSSIDISDMVVKAMDETFAKEPADKAPAAAVENKK